MRFCSEIKFQNKNILWCQSVKFQNRNVRAKIFFETSQINFKDVHWCYQQEYPLAPVTCTLVPLNVMSAHTDRQTDKTDRQTDIHTQKQCQLFKFQNKNVSFGASQLNVRTGMYLVSVNCISEQKYQFRYQSVKLQSRNVFWSKSVKFQNMCN